MKNEIEVALPNGYTIQLFEHEGDMILGLVNQSGFYVSDTRLNEAEVSKIDDIISDYYND